MDLNSAIIGEVIFDLKNGGPKGRSGGVVLS